MRIVAGLPLRRLAAALAVLALGGCSAATSPIEESYPPEKSGQVAIETYDANRDGKIDGAELEKCLALKYAMPRVDKNGDKSVTADEIAERMRTLTGPGRSKRMGTMVQIISNRGPVSGATVKLEMEPFMGGGLPTYALTTDETGSGVPERVGADKPEMAIPIGFYRITISAPGGAGEVVRGCEVADDSPTNNRLIFSLDQEAPQGTGGGSRFGGR